MSLEEQAAFLGGADSLPLTRIAEGNEGQVYEDGRLTTAVYGEDQSVTVYSLSMGERYNTNGTEPNYLELVPVGDNKFEVRFSLVNRYPEHDNFRIYKNYASSDSSRLVEIENFIPEPNVHYSQVVELEPADIADGVAIAVVRYNLSTNKLYRNQVFFHIQELSLNVYMLKLNKAIRLCRATGITPEQLESLIYSAGKGGKIDDTVISLLFTALYFRQKYKTSQDDALVLAGGPISQFAGSTGACHFDTLFNTPALAGEWFGTNGSSISLAPDAEDASFARDSLLRGLAVTRGELYQLGLMSGLITVTETALVLTLANISTLYRLSLVARLNRLTVNELYLIFSVSPFTAATGSAFVQYLYQLSLWMSDVGLTASEVWMLTSADHSEILTPEMQTLRSTIAAALSAQDMNAADDDARRRLIAPYISGTLGLSSPDLAASLILWCETAEHFTLTHFMDLLLKDNLSEQEMGTLSGYLHVLAQYSLTVQALGLSDAEVSVLAGVPGTRQIFPDEAQNNALSRLMSLHYFHQWLNSLGRESSAVLAALNEGKLTTELMALAMGQDEIVLTQALSCVDVSASNKTELSNWQTIYQILQWVNVATTLNTMPMVVKQLVDIRLSGTSDAQPSWAEWKKLSRSLEAALTQRQAAMLAASSAGRLSEVLCNWFLANVENEGLNLHSRDNLYSYFLIDNQVSADVKTTRLAEAISGIQLYINRALNRIEKDAQSAVISRQFFIDWEMNSRYSTWSGVSRLVYYPENYIDPLQRIGQTRMMDELLQNINQSQLSEDTVEDAFKAYLARFETVADLKVISVYHNNVNSDGGKTWFIGRSRESVPQYYWRNTDMSYLSRDGKLAANAWSEWVNVDVAINAWEDSVRPIIFKDRLNIAWIEREEVATNATSSPVISYRFTLKLSFLRHDGNWSSPWVFDITSSVTELKLSANELPGFTVSEHDSEGFLIAAVYKLSHDYTTSVNAQRIHIYSDGSYTTYSGLGTFSSIVTFFNRFKSPTDNTIIYRASYRLTEAALSVGTTSFSKEDFGRHRFSKITASSDTISLSEIKNEIFLSLKNLKIDVEFKSMSSSGMAAEQLQLIHGSGKVGDVFILAGSVPMSNLWQAGIYSVYNKTNGKLGYIKSTNTVYSDQEGTGFFALSNSNASVLNESDLSYKTSDGYERKAYYQLGVGKENDFKSKKYTVSFYKDKNTGNLIRIYNQSVISYTEFNSSLTPESVIISLPADKTQNYTAQEYASSISSATDFITPKSFYFNELSINVSGVTFVNNKATIDLQFSAGNGELGIVTQEITLYKSNYKDESILAMYETETGVQYLETGVYRIRLNTLLAPQLVSRANAGISSILSMQTQQLQEFQLGKGFFASFVLPPYNKSTHGNSTAFSLGLKHVLDDTRVDVIHSGVLTDRSQIVTLFIPTSTFESQWNLVAKVMLLTEKFKDASNVGAHFINQSSQIVVRSIDDISMFESVVVLNATSASLDFNSSSALYYWELFYYVPMMCFRRLLQEKKFEEARAWMNYVWNPNGYTVNGEIAPWTWNCRPLEETTSWNANPLDTIDPDAVAQHDPTHYKVATFMNFIELLVTRGDMRYRQLERDSLAEAKMWYVFALSLLGEEPQDYGRAAWIAPSLANAASTTTQNLYQDMLAAIEPDIILPGTQDEDETRSDIDDSTVVNAALSTQIDVADEDDMQTRTANSLTGLFLPEYNPALTEMWATLRLRLYNLRNNLSIDGQPLSLSYYAEPVDPAALRSSIVQSSQGGAILPAGTLSLYHFPVMLERARNLVSQLTQFGSSLLSMAEHDDADEFSILLMQQGMELMTQSILLQERTVEETEADITTLKVALAGARERLDKYTALYNEDVSSGERQAMMLADSASALTLAGQTIGLVGGAADLVPNTFGLACGGSRWGALSHAMSNGMALQSASIQVAADKVSRSEMYRRRREEWEIQRNSAQSEVDQIEAQLAGLAIRLEAANLQVDYLETQQGHTLAQLEFMQRKFTNQALYNWMRGKLSAIYYQFFDIAQSCCLMAQEALRRELSDNSLTFIRGSAWNGATAGFMAGETLLLNLAEMDGDG